MYEVGKTYHRMTDIHDVHGGQQRGGIATPANSPYVFLFTSSAGEEFGYLDQFGADGTFWYTGEGQVGDMEIIKGNKAIINAAQNEKALMLFEATKKKGYVRFVGKCEYVEHHFEERPDKNLAIRKAIVFHLLILPEKTNQEVNAPKLHTVKKLKKSLSLADLKAAALADDVSPLSETKLTKKQFVKYRSEALKLYALKRSDGICEGCGAIAPFKTYKGPFLEVHHLNRIADGGLNTPENVAALCPNCHRRAHYAVDAEQYNQTLIDAIKAKEKALA